VRGRVADYIAQQTTVAVATARHSSALARNFADFPAFLKQFGPAMERIGKFADETTPTFTDLKAAAPGINEAFTELAPFSNSSTKFFQSLGKTAQVSGPAIAATKPLLERVQSLGGAARPFAGNLSELLSSLRSTGGLERLLDLIFLGGGSMNGYDSLGHFLRAEIIGKTCVGYKVAPQNGCGANFVKGEGSPSASSTSASAATSSPTSLVMDRTLAVLNGATPAQAIAKYPGPVPTLSESAGALSSAGSEGGATSTAKPVGGTSGGTTYYAPSAEESSGASGMLLKYLLGN
jgi:hypothetical protein